MTVRPLVMVVEDNKITQDTLKRDLTPMGMELIQVPSAEEALAILESGKIPDVIILDFHLPGEDGPGFYRRISVDNRFRQVSVIPFTALYDQMDMGSVSTMGSFVSTRGSADTGILPIVSKKGREDVAQTPGHLFLAIAHCFQQRGLPIHETLRARVREALGDL
jgi:CheY-like chemotaxis protein